MNSAYFLFNLIALPETRPGLCTSFRQWKVPGTVWARGETDRPYTLPLVGLLELELVQRPALTGGAEELKPEPPVSKGLQLQWRTSLRREIT